MNSKRVITIAGILLVVLVGVAIGYIVKMQQLVMDEAELSNKICTEINPLSNERSKLYRESLSIGQSGDEKRYWKKTYEYLMISERVADAQKEWLASDKTFISKWDFKLLVPDYLQEIARLQFDAKKADLAAQEQTNLMLARYMLTPESTQTQLVNEILLKAQKRDELTEQMNKVWKEHENKFDIRVYFVQIPPDICANNRICIEGSQSCSF